MKVNILGNAIRTEQDLHHALAEKLGFGPYYGNNLAALWDRMTTDVERPLELIWDDSSVSKAAMGEQLFENIVKVFREVELQDRDFGRSEAFTLRLE